MIVFLIGVNLSNREVFHAGILRLCHAGAFRIYAFIHIRNRK